MCVKTEGGKLGACVPTQDFPRQGQQWVYPLQRLAHALCLVTALSPSPKALSEFPSL